MEEYARWLDEQILKIVKAQNDIVSQTNREKGLAKKYATLQNALEVFLAVKQKYLELTRD